MSAAPAPFPVLEILKKQCTQWCRISLQLLNWKGRLTPLDMSTVNVTCSSVSMCPLSRACRTVDVLLTDWIQCQDFSVGAGCYCCTCALRVFFPSSSISVTKQRRARWVLQRRSGLPDVFSAGTRTGEGRRDPRLILWLLAQMRSWPFTGVIRNVNCVVSKGWRLMCALTDLIRIPLN